MEELSLGPNGGLLYCMEYLEENLDEWLGEQLQVGAGRRLGVWGVWREQASALKLWPLIEDLVGEGARDRSEIPMQDHCDSLLLITLHVYSGPPPELRRGRLSCFRLPRSNRALQPPEHVQILCWLPQGRWVVHLCRVLPGLPLCDRCVIKYPPRQCRRHGLSRIEFI